MIPTDAKRAALVLVDPERPGLATVSAEDSAPKGSTARQAWLRAMEQAQMARWFHSFDAPISAGASPAAARLPAAMPLRSAPLTTAHRAVFASAVRALPHATVSVVQGMAAMSTESRMADGSAAVLAERRAPQGGDPLAGLAKDEAGTHSLPVAACVTGMVQRVAVPLADGGAPLPPAAQLARGSCVRLPISWSADISPDSAAGATRRDAETREAAPATAVVAVAAPAPDAAAVARTVVASVLATVSPSASMVATVVEPRSVDTAAARPPADAESAAPTEPMAAATSDRVAVRSHAQWGAQGLELWLGLDGNAAQVALQASVIVQQLGHALGAQGQRLQRVVCNGRVVWDPTTGIRPATSPRFTGFLDPPVQPLPARSYPAAIPSPVFQEIP